MQISASLKEDVWHNLRDAGSYEWWYFDAQDESETYSFVAIWYSGFPFSPYYLKRYNDWQKHGSEQPFPLEHAAFSFNFYENGKEVINFIKEGDAPLFAASTKAPFARFEKNEFFYDHAHNRFTLRLDFDMPLRRKTVKAELHFSVRPIDSSVDLASLSSGAGAHSWVLASPSNSVAGDFEIFDGSKTERVSFNGRGYHDHNFGRVPMSADIHSWYWGRAHSRDLDLVYYTISYKDQAKEPFSFLLLTRQDRVLAAEHRLKTVERAQAGLLFTPRYATRLCLSNARVHFAAEQVKILDTGPFYLRFNSEFDLSLDGARFQMSGISEFLHPERINSSLVLNLIKSKIWREDEWSVMYTLYNFFNRLWELGTKRNELAVRQASVHK